MTAEYAIDSAQPTQPTAVPERTAGPLIAVRALCGGAGASTLTYLLAQWMTQASSSATTARKVLAVDADCATGGLSLYAGIASPRSLIGLANDIEASVFSGRPFASRGDGVRLIATGPRAEPACSEQSLSRVLVDARNAHSLTIADCGTATTSVQRLVLGSASCVIWVLPASQAGVDRARAVVQSQPQLATTEIVVARRDHATRRPPTRALTALAASRNATLVLMPSVANLTPRSAKAALEECSVSLLSLATTLRL